MVWVVWAWARALWGSTKPSVFSYMARTKPLQSKPVALLLPVLQQYEPVFKPNAFLEYLPTDYKDGGAFLRRRMSGK
mgnify:CR=1 FL=1